MEHKYNNLGQIIEGRLVYFRSTDIEQKNYRRLFWSIPDEWFLLLAVGDTIQVNEISTKIKGKVERIFIPILNDILNYLLLSIEPKNKKLKDGYNIALQQIKEDTSLYQKIILWKGKIKNEINISCNTIKVDKEPNTIHNM